jgi:tRNA (guanine37-N1)-methyltransferase
MMTVDIMTLFPDTVGDMLCESVLGIAQERGYIRINTWQIRDYTVNKQKQVDDYPYGGGLGIVMAADPLYRCWEHICQSAGQKLHTVLMSPSGKTFLQADAKRLREYDRFIIVCGHYEGIDERFIEECVNEEISLGDFVLTGGEIPAMAVTDAVCRLVPGVLAGEECYTNDSHWDGLLEHPHYTRPEEWHGKMVPDILLSGHHANIARWRRKESIRRTMRRRPDLFRQFEPRDKQDIKILDEIQREEENE